MEDLPHLVAVLHVEAVAVEAEALRIVQVGGGPDAEERVVVGVVVALQVVRVVRRDQRDPQVARHLHQALR